MAQDDVIGKIEFQAPDEGTGTDAILVSAAIQAVAEGDFSSSSNATSLQFMTGSSEAAAEKMTLTSAGILNAGKIGVVGDHDLGVGLHVKTADCGSGANADADEIVVENSGDSGISILSGTGSAGKVLFGDSGANDIGGLLYVHAGNTMRFYVNESEHFRIADDGTLTATDTSIGSNSDSRVKENISNFTYDIAKFKQLQPRTFDWKNPSSHNGENNNRGFIAQEVKAIDDYWTGELDIGKTHSDYNLLDSVTKNNCVINDGTIFASDISESNWEAGKLDGTYPKDSTWKASAEGDKISLTSKLDKKDTMYVSVINQLITKIETLEAKVAVLEG